MVIVLSQPKLVKDGIDDVETTEMTIVNDITRLN